MPGEGVVATLRAGWDALGSVDAPMAVIGGLALTAWRHARYTRDADVLVAIDEGRFNELLAALTAAGFRPRHSPALRVIDGQAIAQFTFHPAEALLPFQFDVLLVASGFQREAVQRAVPWPLAGPGGDVLVVRPDDLVVIKLQAGRIIDRADAAMVLRENRCEIEPRANSRAICSGCGEKRPGYDRPSPRRFQFVPPASMRSSGATVTSISRSSTRSTE